jgi:hypothetical protein
MSGVDKSPCPYAPPDITFLLFYLGEDVKCCVFRTSVDDIATLRARITEAIRRMVEIMLTHTWAELDYRIDVIRATRSFRVEVDQSTRTLFESWNNLQKTTFKSDLVIT